MRTKDKVQVNPTPKQEKAFKLAMENAQSDKPQPMGVVLRKAGYGRIANSPCRILDSKGFQMLLAQVDDGEIIARFRDIVRDEDKRSSIAAGVELLKLKDRYPKDSNKFISLFTKIDELETKD